MPLELSVSDTTIWSITLESSVTILETSFSLIYDVYSAGITHDDHQMIDHNMLIVQATGLIFESYFKVSLLVIILND